MATVSLFVYALYHDRVALDVTGCIRNLMFTDDPSHLLYATYYNTNVEVRQITACNMVSSIICSQRLTHFGGISLDCRRLKITSRSRRGRWSDHLQIGNAGEVDHQTLR